jgi:hypothetical protein
MICVVAAQAWLNLVASQHTTTTPRAPAQEIDLAAVS